MSNELQQLILWLIPVAPLLAAAVTALLGPKLLRDRSHLPCQAALATALAGSLALLFHIIPEAVASGTGSITAVGYQWLDVGGLNLRIDLRADAMTAIMLTMVTFVSFLVSIFASGYMHGDRGYARFFAAVSLFVFSMCMLVLSKSFLMLFVFWEAVGLCSYLLIGFWFEKPAAAAAAKKAFVVNRIGDLGFIIGIFLIWQTFGSLDFDYVLGDAGRITKLNSAHPGVMTTICLLLFLGAMGKSAQFPLHVWLPDAMEGPTPVSALIHAATMVTAGVYMVARSTPLFVMAPDAQLVVSGIGAATALIAALTALTQHDLKRVMAYSTVSQLGYMFMALGAAAGGGDLPTLAVTAAMFHLFTHAFFKALLFLASGSVMHSMGDVIDMREFSGLRKALPITHWTFLCGAGALAGFPLLAGFWSKDDILAVLSEASHHPQYGGFFTVIQGIATVTALLTAFYTFRAYFRTFHGEEKFPAAAGHHPHDAPPAMAWPLRILAFCAIGIGLLTGPTHLFSGMLQNTMGLARLEAHGFHVGLMVMSAAIAIAGIVVARQFYLTAPSIPAGLARSLSPLHRLSEGKFFFDEIFTLLVVLPLRGLAAVAAFLDRLLVDGIVNLIGWIPQLFSNVPRALHNGQTAGYGIVMWTGAVICVLIMLGAFRQ